MVMTFSDAALETLWTVGKSKGVRQDLQKRALLALDALSGAATLRDVDPSFRVHPLAGTKPQRFAMKVSAQWRITFEPRDGGLHGLRLEQYH